jgi:hypothetical protein
VWLLTEQAEAFLRNHPKTNLSDFRTPSYLITWINENFGPIHYDAACIDGLNNLFEPLRLEDDWPEGSTIYSNPPFDAPSILKWFAKGLEHTKTGGTHIMLIPNKLCQKTFCDNINPHIQELVFLGGRINFEGPNIVKGGSSRNGCLLLINKAEGLNRFMSINLSEIKASKS